jgi:Flp pilus assembly protein TadG
MKNNRGQALIEFVLILPVLLLLIFALIDFGRIIVCKSHLEGVMNEVSNLTDDEITSYLKKDTDYKITYTVKLDEYRNITLTTKLDLITPGLKNILSNPYVVKVERSIVYE